MFVVTFKIDVTPLDLPVTTITNHIQTQITIEIYSIGK